MCLHVHNHKPSKSGWFVLDQKLMWGPFFCSRSVKCSEHLEFTKSTWIRCTCLPFFPDHLFPDYPKTLQIFQKLSRLSKNFQDNPEIFETVQKLPSVILRFTRKKFFPDNPDPFQTVRKLPSVILRFTHKNFPDAQKLATHVLGSLIRPSLR